MLTRIRDFERTGALIYPGVVTGAPVTNSHGSAPLVFTGIFSAEECTRIMGLGARRPKLAGTMMYAKPNIRKSTIAWIDVQDDSRWLYDKVWSTFLAVNRWFKYDLLGLVDEIQFAQYGVGDAIGWHLDTGGGQASTRKLSMSVQLCDDEEYSGGDLELCACPQLEPRRRRGTIIVFPSFLAHRVTPITRGTRCSLVAWAHGPVFK